MAVNYKGVPLVLFGMPVDRATPSALRPPTITITGVTQTTAETDPDVEVTISDHDPNGEEIWVYIGTSNRITPSTRRILSPSETSVTVDVRRSRLAAGDTIKAAAFTYKSSTDDLSLPSTDEYIFASAFPPPGTLDPIAVTISPAGGDVGGTFTAVVTGDLGTPEGNKTFAWKDGDTVVATGATYTPDAAIAALTVAVVVSNIHGTASAESDPIVVSIAPEPPRFDSVPDFTVDTATLGGVLTITSLGDPQGYPAPTVTMSVQRNGEPIAGYDGMPAALGPAYTFTADDVGQEIDLYVRAGDGTNFVEAYSDPITVEATPEAPANVTTPIVGGEPIIGETLIVANFGDWSGYPAEFTFASQWQENEVDIPGATNVFYTVQSDDAGGSIRVKVTASNGVAPDAVAYSEPVTIGSAVLVSTQRMGEVVASGFDNAAAGVLAGDLIVYHGFIHNLEVVPALPAGYEDLGSAAFNSAASLAAIKIADETDVGATWFPSGITRGEIAVIQGADPANPVTFSGFVTSNSNTPNWPVLDVAPGLVIAMRGVRAARTVNTYPGMQILETFGGQNSSLQASVEGTGPYTTVPIGPLTAYQEPDIGGLSVSAHTALLRVNSGSTPPAPPANISRPTVAGDAIVGGTLSVADSGNWTGVPTPALSLQWLKDGSDIPGETGASYLVQAEDEGAQIGVRVTATNSEGSLSAVSDTVTITTPEVLPVNTTPPSISGGTTVGSVLTADDGEWTDADSLSRQWRKDGVAISGQTGPAYTTQAGDAGAQIDILVTAMPGSVTAASDPITIAAAAEAPVNTVRPTTSGSGAVIGNVLSRTSTGTWTGTPTPAFVEQNWQRGGVDIPGATGNSYTTVLADSEQNVRLRVRFGNTAGEQNAFSLPTAVAAATVPVNDAVPVTSGSTTQGGTATATTGEWSGNPPPSSYARQWQRDAVNIAGATGSSRGLSADDVGHQLRHRVIASNIVGASAPAFSAPFLVLGSTSTWDEVVLTTSNFLSRLAAPETRRTRYRWSPGTYPDHYIPANKINWPIEFVPLDRSNPPIIRAMAFGRLSSTLSKCRNFRHIHTAPAGSNFTKKIKLDGLNFTAQRFASATINGETLNYVASMGDGSGIGYRTIGTSHPSGGFAGMKEAAGYIGLSINEGEFEIVNCRFDGYSIQIDLNPGVTSADIHHSDFIDACEDICKFRGDNVTFRDNHCGGRPASAAITVFTGGPSDRAHGDTLQAMSNWTNLRILRNDINDPSGYLAGGQIKAGGGSSGKCSHLLMEGNLLRNHAITAWWMNNFTRLGNGVDGSGYDIIIRGNKQWSPPGIPLLAPQSYNNRYPHWGNNGADYGNARILFDNNIGGKLFMQQPHPNMTYTRNVQTNSGTTWPIGWPEIARDRVVLGHPYAGRYGDTAGVIPN